MKKYIIIQFLVIASINGFSQEKSDHLVFNPFQAFKYKVANIEYERAFAKRKIGIAISYGQTCSDKIVIDGHIIDSKIIDLSVIRYQDLFTKSTLWYGAQINFSAKDIKTADNVVVAKNMSSLAFIVKEGYQFVVDPFAFNVYIGLGYKFTNNLLGQTKYYHSHTETIGWLFIYGVKAGIIF